MDEKKQPALHCTDTNNHAIKTVRVGPRRVMAKMLNTTPAIYIHFRTNTLSKGMNPLFF